jgi:anti-sigma factor RsiW
MDTHDAFRELAALRLYGELDPAELARLERHLAQCEACAELARDLEAGLGRLVPDSAHDDLPSEWKSGLEAAIVADGEPDLPAVPRSTLWVAAASFLVGAAVAWSAAPGRGEAPVTDFDVPNATAVSRSNFERSTPPPLARETASLPPLAELYLRR